MHACMHGYRRVGGLPGIAMRRKTDDKHREAHSKGKELAQAVFRLGTGQRGQGKAPLVRESR